MSPRDSRTAAALAALILIWGYSWVAMKICLRYAHPLDFAALRTGLGAAFLFAILALRGGGLGLASHRMAVLLGLLQVAAFVVLSNYALALTETGHTSVLVYTMPFWMIVFAHLILHERMRGVQRWHDFARPSRVFGVVLALSAVASVALTETPVQGLAQRIVAVIVPLGVVALAARVLQVSPRLERRDQEKAGLLPGGKEMSNAFNVNDTST